MRTWLSAFVIMTGLGASLQFASAQDVSVEKLIRSGKVHPMTLYNGPIRTVHYFPLAQLTAKELATLRADEREVHKSSIIRTVEFRREVLPAGLGTPAAAAAHPPMPPTRREVLPAGLGTPAKSK